MATKVMMIPHTLSMVGHAESGIKTLVAKYFEHLHKFDIELVKPNANSFDVMAVHAGMSREYPNAAPMVAHIHGLYWTADYQAADWQYKANRDVMDSILHSYIVTSPSEWVAKTLQRDMHLAPRVVNHGIDWQEWSADEPNERYILWNKNRSSDVCDPKPMNYLAKLFPRLRFLTTFTNQEPTQNIKATGIVPHTQMKSMVEQCGVYLSTTKETFGIGILEAMAAGKPVLGFAEGGILETVKHGVNGYLARPGDFEDLKQGLIYCVRHAETLGANSRRLVQNWGWDKVLEQVAQIYRDAEKLYNQPHDVSVVIPCYNKEETLERAVYSALQQSLYPKEIIIVDNNSDDGSHEIGMRLEREYEDVTLISEPKQGVAHARNAGVERATSRYICCLDADDEISEQFLEVCIKPLKEDNSLGLAYTRLLAISKDGNEIASEWPREYDFDKFLKRQNPVPTCCVFRKELWERIGGYRQRYAPTGAGAEDAEFWFRMGASGYPGVLASEKALFRYHLGGTVSADPHYREVDWQKWHPWVKDKQHPFPSPATPRHQYSHPVRQYDVPEISVIIPCSPAHLDVVEDALDSLEAQSYRKWEAIVVLDGNDGWEEKKERLLKAYPYVNWLMLLPRKGAGAARNFGAENAIGKFLFFLDADDWLEPECLTTMLKKFALENSIAYSDYYGYAYISKEHADEMSAAGRLVSYDEDREFAMMRYHSANYDCSLAMRQPQFNDRGEFYIWCLVSSLVPKLWHDEIEGFDEEMESWEDWDYWLRMARAGRCFTKIDEPLVSYRFYTGERREKAFQESPNGRQRSSFLINYLTEKYERSEDMGCGGCSKQRANPVPPPASQARTLNMGMPEGMSVESMIWVRLNDGNVGDHPIIGAVTKTRYGYKKHGDEFKMLREDASSMPTRYVEVSAEVAQSVEAPEAEIPKVLGDPELLDWEGNGAVEPETIEEEKEEEEVEVMVSRFEFETIWGLKSADRIDILVENGIRTLDGLLSYPQSRLEVLLNVPPATASRIIRDAKKKKKKLQVA